MRDYSVPEALISFVNGALNNIGAWLTANHDIDTKDSNRIIGEWLVALTKSRGVPVILGKDITEALKVSKGIINVSVEEFGLTLLAMSETDIEDEENTNESSNN